MKRWFHRVVLARPWLTFALLVVSFGIFGMSTLNLFYLLRANSDLVLEHGWQALMDGAARQFLDLLINILVGMAAYVVFKTCEHRLVHSLGEPPES